MLVASMTPTAVGGRINIGGDEEVDEVDEEEAQLKSFCRRDVERDGIRLVVLTTTVAASNSSGDKVKDGQERDPLTGNSPS